MINKFFKTGLMILLFSSIITFANDKAELNKKAPDFVLKGSDNKEYKLSDYKDKIVVLEWNNFDCPFVKKHYNSNNMQNLQKKYTEKGVIWLTINSSAKGKQGNFPIDELNEKIKTLKTNMTAYLLDESGKVGKMYGAKTTPHMYIINKGTLLYAGGIDDKPSTDEDDIKDSKNYVSNALEEILTNKEVTTKSAKPYGCSVKY